MTEDTANLGRQMARGAAWMVAMRFAIRAIGLVSIVILARLLVPADFGLVALATMLYGLIEVMGQFSFDVVLIQNQSAGRRHYDTAWTLTVIRNLVLAGLLVAGARYAAGFFEEPRLEAILYWLALAALVEGFANIGVVNFRKELRFHKDFAFMVGAKLGMFVVAVPLAFLWRDYWALVAGIVAGAFARVALGYLMQPYRPRFSLAKWREIMAFSKWLVVGNLLRYFQNRADTMIVGKLIGATGLGLYSIAYEISALATSEIVAPIRRAILPGYSAISGDSARLRRGYLQGMAVILSVGAPIAAGIGLTSELLIPLFLGPKWLEAVPLLQVLALSGLLQICTATTSPLLVAMGKPQLVAAALLCSVVIGVPLIIWAGLGWGVIGVAWGTVGASTVLAALFMRFGARSVGVTWKEIAGVTWRTLLSLAIMAIAVWVLVAGLPHVEAPYLLAGELGLAVSTGAIVYVALHLGLWQICGAPDGPEERVLVVVRDLFRRHRVTSVRSLWRNSSS